jgi:hypothetical protein
MVSILAASCFRSNGELRKLRRLLGWQSSEFDGRMRCGTVLLDGLWFSKFFFFSSYALFRLILPFTTFFFTLLETYDLELHHLLPHSITLVAIFILLCEMYVGVWPSVRLFRLFRKKSIAHRWLLLPGQDQGSSCVHHRPQPQQVRPAEG